MEDLQRRVGRLEEALASQSGRMTVIETEQREGKTRQDRIIQLLTGRDKPMYAALAVAVLLLSFVILYANGVVF